MFLIMSKINSLFGNVVRKLREERGWSQLGLAVRAESGCKYISDVELGKRSVSLLYAKKIADVFDLTLYELFCLIEKEGNVEY